MDEKELEVEIIVRRKDGIKKEKSRVRSYEGLVDVGCVCISTLGLGLKGLMRDWWIGCIILNPRFGVDIAYMYSGLYYNGRSRECRFFVRETEGAGSITPSTYYGDDCVFFS